MENNELNTGSKMELQENWIPGRVIAEYRGLYRILTEKGECNAKITGKMYYRASDETFLPAVGDYVRIDMHGGGDAVLREIFPRKSEFVRKAAGPVSQSQTLAANFDYVFIITSMNYDFNIGRLDRYVAIAWESGGIPVIILNKADLVDEREEIVNKILKNYPGVAFHITSNVTGEGMDELREYFTGDKTVVFLGSSGVGKSSLLNYLYGEELMEVKDLRGNLDKGQHTTTHRQLVALPGGGNVIDTPGMRELGLWHAGEGLDKGFSNIHDKIESFAQQCRFSDCTHRNEPGCAVSDALKMGDLSNEQYERYRKLQREALHMERRISAKARIDASNKRKAFARKIRNQNKVQW